MKEDYQMDREDDNDEKKPRQSDLPEMKSTTKKVVVGVDSDFKKELFDTITGVKKEETHGPRGEIKKKKKKREDHDSGDDVKSTHKHKVQRYPKYSKQTGNIASMTNR